MKKSNAIFILIFLLFVPSLIQSTEKKEFRLAEIIDFALENNPLLSAKKNEVEARKASYQASKRLANPELELNIGRAKAAEFSHSTLTLEVTFTIKNLYFEILRLKFIQELAQKNLDSIQKIHRLIEKRAKLGEIKELEAIKLYVESLQAQRELNKIQTDLVLAKKNLIVLPLVFQTLKKIKK
ncbi:MAG: TolC family protein [Candidatus Aminicenantaceae bacterium]